MLRKIVILKGDQVIYRREYGDTFSWEAISPLLVSLTSFVKEAKGDVDVDILNTVFYKIAYSTNKQQDVLFEIIADINDPDEIIIEQLPLFNSVVSKKLEGLQIEDVKDEIDIVADQLLMELPPKIAIAGASGVGKSTITALVQNEKLPESHIPTITCDVDEIIVGGVRKIYLHDTGGQEQFGFLWPRWIKGADGVILVLDSTKANLKESKFFVEMIQKETPKASVIVIANKQDLPDAISPDEIEKTFGYKTYPMIAIDRSNREKLLTIFAEVLKLTSQVASLIPNQVKEDTVIKEQEREIEITPELEAKIKKVQAEIDKVDKDMKNLKKEIKKLKELGEEFYKLNADLMVANVKKRRLQKDIRALLMSGGESKVLAFDVHQEMRNVSYVIRCECGEIYKKLAPVKRGMKNVVLQCPKCQTEYEVPKKTWEELYIAAFPK